MGDEEFLLEANRSTYIPVETLHRLENPCDKDVHFKNMILPGFGRGMGFKTLSFDNETGACSMTVQFEGGYKQTPGFSWSELEMIVVEGELQVGDKTAGRVGRHVTGWCVLAHSAKWISK